MKNIANPFLVKGYAGPDLFCDRTSETGKLYKNMVNGLNTLLISNRRMGKTSLILHTFHKLSKRESGQCLYVDVLGTKNLNELVNQLAGAIMNAFPEKNRLGKQVLKWIKTLSPVISYDPFTGVPQVSLTYSRPEQTENSLQSLFHFVEQMNIPVIIAFDEFQQVLSYPEKNVEAILRTHIQHLQNLTFIFSGSSKHIITGMFNDHSRPFFASTQLLSLAEISYNEYSDYIKSTFLRYKRNINTEAIDHILNWTRRHTYYTQSLCNQLFGTEKTNIKINDVQNIGIEILKEQEPLFYQFRQMLTPIQWKVLNGIAREDKLYKPTSKEFLMKNKIGTPSNVQRAIESLSRYEMIYNDQDDNGPFYRVYNVFLSRWLENIPTI